VPKKEKQKTYIFVETQRHNSQPVRAREEREQELTPALNNLTNTRSSHKTMQWSESNQIHANHIYARRLKHF